MAVVRYVNIPTENSFDGLAKVIYRSKDGAMKKTFDALDWLARLVLHIPDKYEQTVRYYGFYSNKSRGMRKKAETDHEIPSIMPGEMSSKQFRRNWARMIQKIYEIDPLCCPKCQHTMRIISWIEKPALIKKILQHLNLWDTRNHDPPTKDTLHTSKLIYDYSDSQVPPYDYWN